MELADIKIGSEFSDVHALVVDKKAGTTKDGKPFLELNLRSGNTLIRCVKWNYDAERYDHLVSVGSMVKISGKGSPYRGETQGTIDKIEKSDKSALDYAQRSRFDLETLYSRLIDVVNGFTDPMLKHVTLTMLTEYKEKFCAAPAATGVHHSWTGGLLEHTYSMTALASRVCKYYHDQYGTRYFSKDRVLAGTILHDFGKIFEYDTSTPAFKKTGSGLLVNHIVKTPIIVYNVATKWFTEAGEDYSKFERERDHLIHLIASHHGTLEFGSPVVPQSLEAVILHQIDMLDSHFVHALMAVEGEAGDVEGFSKRPAYGDRVQFLMP